MLNETLEHAAVLPHELVVGAELDDLAAVEAHDVVGGLDGGDSVGNGEDGPSTGWRRAR